MSAVELVFFVTSLILSEVQSPSSEDSPTLPSPTVTKVEPAQGVRTTQVTVTGENLPTEKKDISVRLNEVQLKPEFIIPNADGKSFAFQIPPDLPLGKYVARAVFKKDGKEFAHWDLPTGADDGRLRVISDSGEPVKVTAVFPLVTYPDNDTFGFQIIGEGFSPVADDNLLEIDGRGPVDVDWVSEAEAQKRQKTDRFKAHRPSSRKLEFWGIPKEKYAGPMTLRIRVGDQLSDPVPITLSNVSRVIPAVVGFGVILVLGGLMYWILRKRLKEFAPHDIGDHRCNPLELFVLDQETDTYSLSKLQFYVWTGVSVFGYVYLTVARSLVQWQFDLADVPANLPAIIFISATTSVIATGVTAVKGPKGAGEVHPSLADFITSGGVVAPERFQFLVWTLLGAGSFVAMILLRDPGEIVELPTIPQGFLALMGVSSAGYVGGKLTRTPGPIIDEIIPTEGTLTLEIRGRNLSQDATFRIGTKAGDVVITRDRLSDKDSEPKVKIVTPEDAAEPKGFAKCLRIIIVDPDPKWTVEKTTLTLINPDGQKAAWEFEVKKTPTTLEIAADVAKTKAENADTAVKEARAELAKLKTAADENKKVARAAAEQAKAAQTEADKLTTANAEAEVELTKINTALNTALETNNQVEVDRLTKDKAKLDQVIQTAKQKEQVAADAKAKAQKLTSEQTQAEQLVEQKLEAAKALEVTVADAKQAAERAKEAARLPPP